MSQPDLAHTMNRQRAADLHRVQTAREHAEERLRYAIDAAEERIEAYLALAPMGHPLTVRQLAENIVRGTLATVKS